MKNDKNKLLIILVILVLIALVCYQKEDIYVDSVENYGNNSQESEQTSSQNNEEIVVNSIQKLEPELKVYFLDVGQADCIFVQNGNATMLIDAGNNPDGKYVSKYLRKELGIQKIDYLIGTHAHEDHIGGIDIIIEDFDIGTFYMPSKESDNKCYTDVIKWAKNKNVDVISPKVGTKFNVGKAECEIMTQNDNSEDYNETSIVVEMTFGSQKFLFTGDMENVNEESRSWNDIDVLKVAHHGSTYTTSNDFLSEIKPEIAVIMCGQNNEYYYPHEKLIERLEKSGCNDIYVTADDGTIIIVSDGVSNKVETIKTLSFDGNE